MNKILSIVIHTGIGFSAEFVKLTTELTRQIEERDLSGKIEILSYHNVGVSAEELINIAKKTHVVIMAGNYNIEQNYLASIIDGVLNNHIQNNQN